MRKNLLLQRIIGVILLILFLVGCGVPVMPSITPAPPTPYPSPSPDEQMMIERIMKWKGEKVILLDGGEDGFIGISPSVTLKNEKLWAYHLYDGDSRQGLPAEKYAGKMGAITNIEISRGIKLVITLDDSGEKIVAENAYGRYVEPVVTSNLGFLSEMEAIKRKLGHSVWALGPKELQAQCNEGQGKRINIKNLQKLMVSRVEWGYFNPSSQIPIFLYLKTDRGEEGCLVPFTSFDSTFHLEIPDFYLENPRMLYPDWNDEMWALMDSGKVTVGMMEGIVTVMCGNSEVCSSLSPSSDKISCECGDQRFLIEDRKVTQFVEK